MVSLISSSVVLRDNENRTEQWASSSVLPIAISTCVGSGEPDLQALPEDKVLLPGVIDTTSNTVEHPEVVAERLRNFIAVLGHDRVVGSTDCGFASTASAASVSGEIAWLKLRSLVDGARLLDR